MRDRLALWCIRAAARLTSWGGVYDLLREAERQQRAVMAEDE